MRVNGLKHLLGNEWEITPAGGATGEAFIAQYEDRKLFLKRNSSPFLAVLSAEGIVPKLVWTRRMENGDVITAQHWLNGRELKPIEMREHAVAKLLSKIHHSKELLAMLKRLGKQPLLPEELYKELKYYFNQINMKHHVINDALLFLNQELPHIQCVEKVVCHCDINHNNWLLSERNELFLIDWDGAIIADPAIDIGVLLYWYIPKENWGSWLDLYGLKFSKHLYQRMRWYVVTQTLKSIQWFNMKNNIKELSYWLENLEKMLQEENITCID